MTRQYYPNIPETRDRLRSLRTKSQTLSSLESLFLRLPEIRSRGQSLSLDFESLISDLTAVSDRMESKYIETGKDPEIWSETADLINLLDKETQDLRRSLSDFLKWITDPETEETISLLFVQTADHLLADMIDQSIDWKIRPETPKSDQ